MPQRLTPYQLKSKLRQIERDVNREINKINTANKQAIDNYNREVRAYNSRVRTNQLRLQQELNKLKRSSSSRRTTVHYVTYRASVTTLQHSFDRIEQAASQGLWESDVDLFDMAEAETANSVAVLNTLSNEPSDDTNDDPSLRMTSITSELANVSRDLDARWDGALYALSPRNPDAARHFCTSARELLAQLLETLAPDEQVKTANPQYARTPNGGVSRRARVQYCLALRDNNNADFEDFVVDDIDNVITLFDEFNSGTHSDAGRFNLDQLRSIKVRVESAIQFLYRIVFI